MADQTFVIIDATGHEHEFPVGMDPKKAGAIVRAATITPDTAEPLGPPNQVTAKAEGQSTENGQTFQPNVFQQPISQSIKQGLGGALHEGASMVPGVVNFVKDAVTTLGTKPIEDAGAAMQATAAKADEGDKSLPERFAYDIASRVPFLGPMVAGAGEKLGTGDPAQMGAGALNAGLALGTVSPSIRSASKAASTAAGDLLAKAPGGARVAAAAKEVVANPGSALIGGIEGYKFGGVPGAVAGAVGLPLGKVGLLKEMSKFIKDLKGTGAAPEATPPPKPTVDPVAAAMGRPTGVTPPVTPVASHAPAAAPTAAPPTSPVAEALLKQEGAPPRNSGGPVVPSETPATTQLAKTKSKSKSLADEGWSTNDIAVGAKKAGMTVPEFEDMIRHVHSEKASRRVANAAFYKDQAAAKAKP